MWSKTSMYLVAALILVAHTGTRVNAFDSSVKVKLEVEVRGTLSFTEKEVTVSVEETEFSPANFTGVKTERKWVLDLDTAKGLRKKAKGLHGKAVVVKGKAVLLGARSETFKYKGAIPAIYMNPALKAPDMVGTKTTLDLEHKVEVTSLTAAPAK
jgi:hypothetical protein